MFCLRYQDWFTGHLQRLSDIIVRIFKEIDHLRYMQMTTQKVSNYGTLNLSFVSAITLISSLTESCHVLDKALEKVVRSLTSIELYLSTDAKVLPAKKTSLCSENPFDSGLSRLTLSLIMFGIII